MTLVAGVVDWLKANDTDPCLTRLTQAYLKGRGRTSMTKLVTRLTPPKYRLLAETQDHLGWQNFVKGRFALYYVALQREYLLQQKTWQTADVWAERFIEALLRITHKQWLHQNALVHYTGNRRTTSEKEALARRVEELLWTGPGKLLEEDRPLLDEDCTRTGEANATTQAYWIADVEVAKKTAEYVRDPTRFQGATTVGKRVDEEGRLDGSVLVMVEDIPVEIDSEGSLAYRQRQKRM